MSDTSYNGWKNYETWAVGMYLNGAWCVSDEDDHLYFVSEDGRVDLHDADTFACIREPAGLTQAAYDAYWAQQAAIEEDRQFYAHERDYDRRKYGP